VTLTHHLPFRFCSVVGVENTIVIFGGLKGELENAFDGILDSHRAIRSHVCLDLARADRDEYEPFFSIFSGIELG